MNPQASLHCCDHAQVDPDVIFQARAYDLQAVTDKVDSAAQVCGKLSDPVPMQSWGARPGSVSLGAHVTEVRTFVLECDEPVDLDAFNTWVIKLLQGSASKIYRFKGIVHVKSDPDRKYVFQGVHMPVSYTHLTLPTILLV